MLALLVSSSLLLCDGINAGDMKLFVQYWRDYVDICNRNKISNNFITCRFLYESDKKRQVIKLLEELFLRITFDDVFGDITLTKTRNKE